MTADQDERQVKALERIAAALERAGGTDTTAAELSAALASQAALADQRDVALRRATAAEDKLAELSAVAVGEKPEASKEPVEGL